MSQHTMTSRRGESAAPAAASAPEAVFAPAPALAGHSFAALSPAPALAGHSFAALSPAPVQRSVEIDELTTKVDIDPDAASPFAEVSTVGDDPAPGLFDEGTGAGAGDLAPTDGPDTVQAKSGGEDLSQIADVPVANGGGSALPAPVQAKMEAAFGHSFSDVRVHTGGEASSVGALAYTRGTDIHFQPGLYDPHSSSGQELLGHELTHVVQQRQGRVASPDRGDGAAPINDDQGLEAEADQMGAMAASFQAPTDERIGE